VEFLLPLFKKWGSDVFGRLMMSKRANAAVGGGASLPFIMLFLTNHGMSPNLATAVTGFVAAVVGLFIHSQGSADVGKEAAKLNVEKETLALLGAFQRDKMLNTPLGSFVISKLQGNPILPGMSGILTTPEGIKTLAAMFLAMKAEFGLSWNEGMTQRMSALFGQEQWNQIQFLVVTELAKMPAAESKDSGPAPQQSQASS
jgi:hypothetical protein